MQAAPQPIDPASPQSDVAVDVAIIGAGPAGCAAAITLAEAGRTVAIIDKATFPRDKICGDGLTTGALRRLERLGVQPADVDSWQDVDEVVNRTPHGREISFSLPSGSGRFAAVATRKDLDAALVDRARSSGAQVFEDTAVEAVRNIAGGVSVEASSGLALRSDFAIAADGMWSPTRKLLGQQLEGYRGDWHAFRQYVGGVTGRASRELIVFFEPDFLPGYFWSFPLPGNRANIGFGIQRGGAHSIRDMKHLWPDLLARPHVRELLGPDVVELEPHRAWPIPCRTGDLSASAGRVLFVGDALAVCDVMTGEGIGQALQTGIMAAEHIIDGGAPSEAVGARYTDAVAAELGPDHKMASMLVKALGHPAGATAALTIAGASDWTRRNFIRWLFEDYARGIALRPNTWHRGALTGTGAFIRT